MEQKNQTADFLYTHKGRCPACDQIVTFTADKPYFRNSLQCVSCHSIPRQRALMYVLSTNFPKWRHLRIHESSPGRDIVSKRLSTECSAYVATQFDGSAELGSIRSAPGVPCKSYRNENLEEQTFGDGMFDLVITQDVFEHLLRPDKAIREIARTLVSGGATLMTVPIVRKHQPSRRRAAQRDGEIEHILPPQYHGNPIRRDGSLVTVDWGYDIAAYLQQHSGLSFLMVQIDNIDLGIRADLIEVLIGFKRKAPEI